ncbi:hypothetical protein DFJ74DRAFT_661583, partial [Hyaloraphidium curvatum]
MLRLEMVAATWARGPAPRRLLSSAMPAFVLGGCSVLLGVIFLHNVAMVSQSALSPEQLALGPRTLPSALPYYAPLIRSLSALGPPSPACFRGGAPRALRFDTVLVMAQGRSGSTSLVRLLNSAFRCYNIRGENAGIFSALVGGNRASLAAARAATERHLAVQGHADGWRGGHWSLTSLAHKPAWFNRYDGPRSDALLRLLVGEMMEHVPGFVTSGFKSINLFMDGSIGGGWNDSLAFIDGWIRLFPRTAIVLLARQDAKESGWWRFANWSGPVLAKKRDWMREFHGLVQAGRYAQEGTSVESVEVEFEDLVGCRPGSSVQRMYDVLGEAWDEAGCRGVMAHNVEDTAIADSAADFSTEQGARGFSYGYRLLELLGPDPLNPIGYASTLGPFVPFAEHSNGTFGGEHRAWPIPGNAVRVAISKRFSFPAAGPAPGGSALLAAACTRFRTRTAMHTEAVVRIPGTRPGCASAHSGFAVLLFVQNTTVLAGSVGLGYGNATLLRGPFHAVPGDEAEMCVLPTLGPSRDGEWYTMCCPLLAQLLIMRKGGDL